MGTYRATLRTEALFEQGGCCHYCKEPITPETATADHQWPQARRGRTTRTNIVAACRPCNNAKGSLSHIEFYKLIDRSFPRGAKPEILLIWAMRRIWKKVHRACARIERLCSHSNGDL